MNSGRERYQKLIEHLPDAYAYHQIITDSAGTPVDYIFLDVNRAFEEMTGFSGAEITGKKVTAVLPGIESSGFEWIGTYGKVALEGESICFEQYSKPLQRWYEVTAFSDEPGFFATVFREITTRKQEQASLENLYKMTEELLQLSAGPDYQMSVEALHKLSGAKYTALNTYEDNRTMTVTRALAGLPAGLRRVSGLLGFELAGKAWEINPERLRKIKGGKLVRFSSLDETSMGAISKDTATLLQKIFNLGDIYVIEMAYGVRHTFGDIIFFMQRGKMLQNREAIEMYAGHLANVLMRFRSEQELKTILNEYETVFQGTQDAMFLVEVIDGNTFRYIRNNHTHTKTTGLTPEIIEGKTPRELLGEELGENITANYRRCVSAAAPISYEEMLNLPGGTKTWHTTLTPIFQQNKISYIVGSGQDITDRKQAEQALLKSEARLRAVFQAAENVSFIITDLTPNHPCILEFSPGAEHIFGYRKDEVVGTAINILHTPEDAAQFPAVIEQLRKQQKGFSGESTLVRKSGEHFPALFTTYPLFDDDGRMWGTLGVSIDISERKQAEQALARQLRIEQVVAEISSTFINLPAEKIDSGINLALQLTGELFNVDKSYLFIFSPDGKEMTNTHEWCREEIESKQQYFQNTPTHTYPWTMEKLTRFENMNIPRVAELPAEAAAEKNTFQSHSIKSLLAVPMAANHKLLGFLGFDSIREEKDWSGEEESLLKVTAGIMANALVKQEAERVIKEKEAKYHGIFDAARDAFLVFSKDGRIVEANPAACRIYNYPREELVGLTGREIVHPDYHHLFVKFTNDVQQKAYFHAESVDLRNDGSPFHVEVNGTAIFFNGEDCLLAVIRDITNRKLAEQKFADYTLELEQLYHQLDSEIDKARQVHERILPADFPAVKGLSFAAHYQPAQTLGGDFFDVFQAGDKLIFYLSDVSGHGLDGAMLSVFVKHTIKSYISFTPAYELTPASILRHLANQFGKENYPEDLYVCLFMAVLDLTSMELSYCSAGLQEALLLQLSNGERLTLHSKGMFITSYLPLEILKLQEDRITLTPGSTIFCNTDGITEQESDGAYYMERLPEVFFQNAHLAAHLVAQAVLEDFRQFNNGSLQGKDDITFLVLKLEEISS